MMKAGTSADPKSFPSSSLRLSTTDHPPWLSARLFVLMRRGTSLGKSAGVCESSDQMTTISGGP